jgi:hypothetical protein
VPVDNTTRINKLYARVRVLYDKQLDLLFKVSFDKRMPLQIHIIIKDIELGIGGMYDKK